MKRTLMAVGATLGIVGGLMTTSVAHAQQRQDFGQQGEFIISADRLFSLFSFSSVSQDSVTLNGNGTVVTSNSTYTNTRTGMSILWGSNSLGGLGPLQGQNAINDLVLPAANTFFTVPRVGFDYVVVPNVTIGGDLALFFTLGGHTKTETQNNNATFTATVDSPSTTVFGLAPRAGYVLGLNNMISFWL